MNLPIENSSPFARIAQIYCPNVYEQLINPKEFLLKTTKTSKYYFSTNINILLLCLSISFLCILILLLTINFFSYLTSIHVFIFALLQKFYLLW